MVETNYILNAPVSIALLTDSHNTPCEQIIDSLENRQPQIILMAGDFIYGSYTNKEKQLKMEQDTNAMKLLEGCVSIAPTFVSLGNHEYMLHPLDFDMIEETGAVILDNRFVNITLFSNRSKDPHFTDSDKNNEMTDLIISNRSGTNQTADLCIGGLSSAKATEYQYWRSALGSSEKYPDPAQTPAACSWMNSVKASGPQIGWLRAFEQQTGYKILLCHHPEYYPQYLKQMDIHLICSGHAHGGQWRILNHGLWAPGQGFLPKYTSGVHDGKLVISRGLSNPSVLPRLWNPPEIVYIE